MISPMCALPEAAAVLAAWQRLTPEAVSNVATRSSRRQLGQPHSILQPLAMQRTILSKSSGDPKLATNPDR